ncbi:MAG: hypothetical protein V1933_00600 [Candidatus Omnitrophota bacterium]
MHSRRPATLLTDISIKIPRDLVLSRLKFAKYKTVADKKIFSFLTGVIKEGYTLLEPRVSYKIFDVKVTKGQIKFSGENLVIRSRFLAERLKAASKAALFVCTIGERLTDKVNEYVAKGEIAYATVLDAAGSEAAEALAQKVDDLINKEMGGEGFSSLMRFSPGYVDWSIFDQAKILKVLEAVKIGVKVTKSSIMIPEKSVTACIGLIEKGFRAVKHSDEKHNKPFKK